MRRLTPFALMLAALLVGCTQGSPSDPTVQARPGTPAVQLTAEPGVGFLAAFDLQLDAANATAELTPLRGASAIGDAFSEVGVSSAFKNLFGSNFEVESIRVTGPTSLDVDFRTTHPFTMEARPDLSIFNLKLWVVLDETPLTLAGVEAVPGVVTNADGYGVLWSATHPTLPAALPDVQPFVVLHQDPSWGVFDFQNPTGWNVFAPGQSSLDTVSFDLTNTFGSAHVKLLLTCDYGQSAVRATRQTPAYELPKFAGNAPWKIAIQAGENTLIGGSTDGFADFALQIWDWKHMDSGESTVGPVQYWVPDLMGPDAQQLLIAGTGRDPDPLNSTFRVTNDLATFAGVHWGLIEANDDGVGTAIQDDLVSQTPVASYKTYQFFPVTVNEFANPPEALFLYCTDGDVSVGIEERFDGSWSRMSNYPLVDWEWDYSYVEAEGFNIEDTGSMAWHAWDTPGVYKVALRIRDEAGATDMTTADIIVGGVPTWNSPNALTSENQWLEEFGGPTEPASAIDVAEDGTINLVYTYVVSGITFNTTVAWQQLYPCDPIWTPPQVIWQSRPSTSGPPDVSLAVTMGDYPIVHVTTASEINSYLYLRYQDFAWTAPVTITDDTTPGAWVRGTLARNGVGEVGFLSENIPTQPDAVTGDGVPALPATLHFQQFDGSAFGSAVQIGTADVVTELIGKGGQYTNLSPSIALSGTADNFLAVWESLVTPYDGLTAAPKDAPTKLRWTKRTLDAWDGEQDMASPFQQLDVPVLALAPNGSVWLAANVGLEGNVYLSKYVTSWSFWAPHLIATGSDMAMIDMTFDANGRGALAIAQRAANKDLVARFFDQGEEVDTAAGHNPLVNIETRIPQSRWWPQIQGQNSGRFVSVWETEKYGAFPTGMELDWAMYE